MSEYWKSTPKYWCKHCTTYVKDTKFERTQHEATGRHQGALKRFLRGIQNDHEKGQREKDRAKSEVERLNRAVGGGSVASPPISKLPASRNSASARSTTAPSEADRQRQLAQLVALGVAVPNEANGPAATPGNWQATSEKSEEPSSNIPEDEKLSQGVRKRKPDLLEEEDEPNEVNKKKFTWGTTLKDFPTESGLELDALLSGSVHLKEGTGLMAPKEEVSADRSAEQKAISEPETEPGTMDLSYETSVKVKEENHTLGDPEIKTEAVDAPLSTTSDTAIPTEPVFKKRKSKHTARKGHP